jgi:hypothetical protein
MKQILCIGIILHAMQVCGQELAKITVYAGESDRSECPVSISLDQIDYNQDGGALSLFEISGDAELPVPSQLDPGHAAKLWFILDGETPEGASRHYILKQGGPQSKTGFLQVQKLHGRLRLTSHEHPVLDYQFETLYPPEGIHPLYKRSGFIHPLRTPGGQILTRIQPPDHYHHYGIWGPWTKTHIQGREVDFWNLLKGQGTVRFSGFLSQLEGPVFGGFKALQDHVDFGGTGADQVAIREVLDVRVWNTGTKDVFLMDYTTTLNTPLDSGIMLDAYRYGGGIGFRATEVWHKDNSSVLTSENKDRLSADGTKARWCIIEGESEVTQGRSGILFMGHPSNREFPEPMRVWPVDANGGRGDVYFEFCPIRHQAWMLEKGRDYSLKYRLLVFDGNVTQEEAESYWKGFAHPPRVAIQLSKKDSYNHSL